MWLNKALFICVSAAIVLVDASQSEAGLSISDRRYWPAVSKPSDPRVNAEARVGKRTTKPVDECRYDGGPKESPTC